MNENREFKRLWKEDASNYKRYFLTAEKESGLPNWSLRQTRDKIKRTFCKYGNITYQQIKTFEQLHNFISQAIDNMEDYINMDYEGLSYFEQVLISEVERWGCFYEVYENELSNTYLSIEWEGDNKIKIKKL